MGSRYLIPRHQKPPLLLRMSPMQDPFFLQAHRAPNLESSCLPRVLLRHSLWIPAFNPTVTTPSSLCFSSHFLLAQPSRIRSVGFSCPLETALLWPSDIGIKVVTHPPSPVLIPIQGPTP